MTELSVSDSPKMLCETLCVAATAVGRTVSDYDRKQDHLDRLDRLIRECVRHRPLGVDGKHGDMHTSTCGCEDK